MSKSSPSQNTQPQRQVKSLRRFKPVAVFLDCVALMKPRIIVLLVITCLGAMLVATRGNMYFISWGLVFWTCFGLALSAGAANMINMWYDRDIDRIMLRTQNRPIPAGRLPAWVALFLGITIGIGSFFLLWYKVNFLTACMSGAGYLFYVFIYTMILKRRTVQNIVIGGAAGAFPPLVGWAAVRGDLELVPWLLFLVIFLWTPPHFWALALRKRADYTRANIPMLPVVRGNAETKAQIVYYMLLLIPVTLGLAALEPTFGYIYLTSATLLGGIWLYQAVKLLYEDDIARSRQVFTFSLSYLALLFAAMVVDALV